MQTFLGGGFWVATRVYLPLSKVGLQMRQFLYRPALTNTVYRFSEKFHRKPDWLYRFTGFDPGHQICKFKVV